MATAEQTPGLNAQNPNDNFKELLAPPHVLLSPKPSRKPHRSSPLAGPAAVPLDNKEDFPTHSLTVPRTTSSLSLSTIDERAPPSLQVSSVSSPCLSRPTPALSPDSALSYTLAPGSPTCRRRSIAPKKLIRPLSSVFPKLDSTLHKASHRENSGEGLTSFQNDAGDSRNSQGSQGRPRRYSHGAPLSKTMCPADMPTWLQQPIPTVVINGPEPEMPHQVKATSQSAQTGPPTDNSWYTFNTYAETPRFSRLGLAGGSVVLPVSAKERKKRQSMAPGSGSPRQSADVGVRTRASSHSKEVSQPSLISTLSSGLTRKLTTTTKSNDVRRVSSFCSPAASQRSEVVVKTLQDSSTHSLHKLGPSLPSSSTCTTISSSSANQSRQRTRSSSIADSLDSVFSASTSITSSQTSLDDVTAVQHQPERAVSVSKKVHTKVQHTQKPFDGKQIPKRKSMLMKVKQWTASSSVPPLPAPMGGPKELGGVKGGEKIRTEVVGQGWKEKPSRNGKKRSFFKFFFSSE